MTEQLSIPPTGRSKVTKRTRSKQSKNSIVTKLSKQTKRDSNPLTGSKQMNQSSGKISDLLRGHDDAIQNARLIIEQTRRNSQDTLTKIPANNILSTAIKQSTIKSRQFDSMSQFHQTIQSKNEVCPYNEGQTPIQLRKPSDKSMIEQTPVSKLASRREKE